MTQPSFPDDMQDALTAALADRYVITREIGRGGMATVFLADDLKHQRRVAIKVLMPELGAVLGVERFLSEIRVTANLQHPNLLPLFDSGSADGLLYYVMPFVEGETLRARLDREQQLPVEEAVRLARTMAGALDYAHQRGVIHRDLKPENVLLLAGQPVIADFGIALAVAQAGGQRVTQTGLSLGTPQYMSPEQATGDKVLDARTDLYALGAMTYEMLTGEPPHIGQSAQAIIAKLMTEEVRPLTVLRRSVPATVDVAVRRALEKLPADRFATAGAFAAALGDGHASTERYPAPVSRSHQRVVSVLAAVALIASTVAAWSLWKVRGRADVRTDAPRIERFAIQVDPDGKHALGGATDSEFGRPASNSFAMAPDGSRIVFAAWDSLGNGRYTSRLYVRRLGDERVQVLAGTEGAAHPAYSPDGQWIAFTNGTSVSRVPAEGGDAEIITPAANACCIAWDGNATLLYSDGIYGLESPTLRQVSASGGGATPIALSFADRISAMGILQPLPLNRGRTLLVQVRTGRHPDSTSLYRANRATGLAERVLTNAADPKVLAHEFLIFMRRGTLMAVRFDEVTAKVLGEPVVVVDDVMHSLNMPTFFRELGVGQYAVSERGDLVYARGGEYIGQNSDLVRVFPNGTSKLIPVGLPTIIGPRASPSGDRIAFRAAVSQRTAVSAIFVHELERGITTKVTEGGTLNSSPQWSADGASLAFDSDRADNVRQIFLMAANGTGVRRTVASRTPIALTTYSSTGVFAGTTGDIWSAREGEVARTFFKSAESERYASFSPDGRWLAYSADAGNRTEVFVRPFPGPEPVLQVSAAGGSAPAWSSDGRALYFLSAGTPPAMMRVELKAAGDLQFSAPVQVLDRWPYTGGDPNRGYDVLRDGSFIGVANANDSDATASSLRSANKVTEFHVVINFLQELRARVK